MRRALVLLLPIVAISSPLLAAPVVQWVDFDTEVNAATASRILVAIEDAEKGGSALVVVRLDTPGGLLATNDEIVKRILSSKVPVVAWVGPSGARAASAGFILLIAADVAAMAPGTRTGAATPIASFGKDIPDTLRKKVENDLAAGARSIAEHRGRNVEKSEKAVLAAEAYTDEVALREGIIDLVATDRDDLMTKLDGRTVRRFDGTDVTLETEGAVFVERERNLTQEFWEALGSPILAFFLLVVGVVGLYTEITHPGLIFPGLLGAFSLLLFALSARILPVSLVGLLLVALGLLMFLLEIKVTSHGLLTVGGVACVVLGSIMLFPGPIPEMRLPLAVVLPGSLTLAGFCVVAVRLSLAARRAPVSTGVEGLRGETGVVETELSPEGRVFVHGELWSAVSRSGPVPRGAPVEVVKVDGMQLVVEPKASGEGGKREP
jgi:membrane-bound serine protease (ClpP class)